MIPALKKAISKIFIVDIKFNGRRGRSLHLVIGAGLPYD